MSGSLGLCTAYWRAVQNRFLPFVNNAGIILKTWTGSSYVGVRNAGPRKRTILSTKHFRLKNTSKGLDNLYLKCKILRISTVIKHFLTNSPHLSEVFSINFLNSAATAILLVLFREKYQGIILQNEIFLLTMLVIEKII